MEEVKIYTAEIEKYVFIIFAVLSWIYSMIKKMKKKTPQKPSNPYKPSTNPRKADQIPDILKDLFDDRRIEEVTTPQIDRKEYSEQIQETQIDKRFEKFNGELTQQIETTEPIKKRFEHYKIKKKKTNKYKKSLSTASGMKQAVIASEILKRKF